MRNLIIVRKTRSKKLKKYETVIILDEKKVQDEGKAFAEEFASAVSGAKGEMVNVNLVGRRMFAREIKKHKSGIYLDLVFNAKETFAVGLAEAYKLDSRVLRLQVFNYDRPENQVKLSPEAMKRDNLMAIIR